MPNWIPIGPVADFPPNSQQAVRAQNVPLVIFNIEGLYLAIADVCPHAGLPLSNGELCGKVITCPFHGYTYNVETGKNIDFPDNEPPVRTFPVRANDSGHLEVDVACPA